MALQFWLGVTYIAGGALLLPGFIWIVPTKVIAVPDGKHFDPTTHVPTCILNGTYCIDVPIFDSSAYSRGVNVLIVGMVLILLSAIIDFTCVQARSPPFSDQGGAALQPMLKVDAAPSSAGERLARLVSPLAQVLGAAAILAGCVVFLPKYSNPPPPNPPVKLWGVSAPDLGNDLFQAGAVLYFVGAVFAIAHVVHAIIQSRRRCGTRDCGTPAQGASILAFVAFLATSLLFFINGHLPPKQAVEAGHLRVAASVCMNCAIVILFLVAIAESRAARPAATAPRGHV